MKRFRVGGGSQNVFIDPDPNERPILQLAEGAIVKLIKELDSWAKVEIDSDAAVAAQGWMLLASLVPVIESVPKEIKLFAEPMGSTSRTLLVVSNDTVLETAGWRKVRVTTTDGLSHAGWVEIQPAIAPSSSAAAPAVFNFGPNEIYREALLAAQAKTGIDAAAIAALIDAEAGFIQSGPARGQWNPNAVAGTSSAAGLTQFLASSWIGHAEKTNTELHSVACQRGLVTSAGEVTPGSRLALLNLRFDPALSIISAAECGGDNLAALARKSLVSADEPDDRKARYMYLAHHEGLAGAIGFLKQTTAYTEANLATQVGRDRAAKWIAAAGGNASQAYRDWLTEYMDSKIRPDKYRVLAGSSGPTGPSISIAAAAQAARLMLPENPEEVMTYLELGAGSRALLQSYAGPAYPFETIGGNNRMLAVAIQEALSIHGYLDPPADGEFAAVSVWALAQFCRRLRLPVDQGILPDICKALAGSQGGLPEIRPSGRWIDAVIAGMQARRFFINRHPSCVNIVYVEGMNADGTLNDDAPNAFNDVRIVFRITETGEPETQTWEATTEPGAYYTHNPLSPKGAARIAFRQFKSWGVGLHPQSSNPRHEALVQTKPVTVHRDFNKDFKRTGDQVERGEFGVNQHWGYDLPRDDIQDASAGCLVGRLKHGHREFMALVKSDARYKVSNNYRFVTAILPGDRL